MSSAAPYGSAGEQDWDDVHGPRDPQGQLGHTRPTSMAVRTAIAVPGVLLTVYGAYRILSGSATTHPLSLAVWLAVAVALHDGILAPVTLIGGALLTRRIPPRGRRYVQGGLVTGGLVTVIAIPLIHRQGQAPAVKALLRQDYTVHLVILLAIIAAGTAAAYGLRVMRDRHGLAQQRHPHGDPEIEEEGSSNLDAG